MTWPGKINITSRLGGRAGGLVRLGDALVPRRVDFELKGENGEPDVLARFEVRDGRPLCIELRITNTEGTKGIQNRHLDPFKLENFAANVFASQAMHIVDEDDAGHIEAHPSTNRADFHNVQQDALNAQRDPVVKLRLDEVAEVYRANVTGSPVVAVRERLNLPSDRTAQRRIAQAREAGLLPKTTRGKREV